MHLRIATCTPLPEPDVDEDLLLAALRARGVDARMAAWNDPREDWDARVPTLIRSTWDYIHHLDEFRAWLARAERVAPVWNPRGIVERNLHKGYLLELERRGIPITPTELLERGTNASLDALRARRGWDAVVIKPAVGAGSFATRRFEPREAELAQHFLRDSLRERDVLVQPWLSSVDGHGERACVWIDGAFTHAVRKTPRLSGQEESVSVAIPIEPAELALGEKVLAPIAKELLYARVDIAPGLDGRPCLMELELVEPSLFLTQHPPALARLVDAIARRLARARAAPGVSDTGS
ncbi:MAG: hypothetical protein IPJ77_08385 [Planctomycetes bacterium]|nr:hypothetical protein [Planctomycetota bacterium]